tara:strand:+ start:12617 stop:12937 length:321 start_codon:yes stop_codon:yes gene_type:complete
MADEIKFTEDEMAGLGEVQQQYSQIQMQLGGLKMQQIAHEKNAERLMEQEEAIMSSLDELSQKEQETAKELNDKYGAGSLNPETGVFTPNAQPPQADDIVAPTEEG